MSAAAAPLFGNPVLVGRDATPGIVAIVPGETTVRVWRRRDGALLSESEPFTPFLLVADPALLTGLAAGADVQPLTGPGALQWIARFPGWSAALQARDHCRQVTGRAPGAPDAPYLFPADPVHQYLLASGRTSFRGMVFGDLRRLALDIEVTTAPGFEFPNAAREADRIIAIAMADSTGWSEVLSGAEMSEAELLAACSRLLAARDPDVIEGHNIFRFDLEYIEARARRLRVSLPWGRDGSGLRGFPSRMQVAERTLAYRRYVVAGRHVVDTWILAQLYDVGARDLESYGLKDIARHFGVAAPERTYLPAEEIPRIFREDPARLMAYARDDVLETLAIAGLLAAPYFVQAQVLPFDYESVVLRGNATKIDALLLREYLHRGRAVPAPAGGEGVGGGHTAVLAHGVARDVVHIDVASLYPSLMLAHAIAPRGDELGIFLELLAVLRAYRLEAKRMAREAGPGAEQLRAGALQQTFKILINSFYGYLGFGRGHWNDFEAANRVTAEGRALLLDLVARLEALGATVIEVDTDGLYLVPPEGRDADALLAELAAALPAGVQLELAGRYPAMFSYKAKNYVLLDQGGRLRVKGSGLRSRGLELFQRRWMEEMFRLLLTGRRAEVPALVERWERDFRAHRVPVKLFMKTETLQDSGDAYEEKTRAGDRNASAAYELARRAERPYQPGDQISYYVTGVSPSVKVSDAAKLASAWDPAAPDENTAYYLSKLRDLHAKFRPFLDLDGLRPPSELADPAEPQQLVLDLGGS